MSFRNRLPLILLIMSLMAMVGVGIGLFLWLDTVKQAEARQLHGNLNNGVGRIQSETALEFTAISVLFTYEVEEIGKLRNAAFFPALTRLVPGAYEKWREPRRARRLTVTTMQRGDSSRMPETARTSWLVFRYRMTIPDLIASSPILTASRWLFPSRCTNGRT